VQSCQLGGVKGLGRRLFRFQQLNQMTLESMGSELSEAMNQALIENIGADFNGWLDAIFPINVNWLASKKKNLNVIFDLDKIEAPKGRDQIQKILSHISFKISDFGEKMKQEADATGDLFFISPEPMRHFLDHPFIDLGENKYLLIAPHLLIRKTELCILSAYGKSKPKGSTAESFYSYFGKPFENYCGQIIERVSKKRESNGAIVSGEFELNPKGKDGKEITDAIVADPTHCVLFEMKFKNTNYGKHLSPLSDYKDLENWLEDTLLTEKSKARDKRNGALRQLAIAAKKIESGELGFPVSHIIPVVVLPEDMVTDHSLYGYLDKKVEERQIFAGLERVRPYLVMSVDALEFLTSMNLPNEKWTLQKVIYEMSFAEGARGMNWSNFLNAIGLKYEMPKDEKGSLDNLVDRAKKLLGYADGEPN